MTILVLVIALITAWLLYGLVRARRSATTATVDAWGGGFRHG